MDRSIVLWALFALLLLLSVSVRGDEEASGEEDDFDCPLEEFFRDVEQGNMRRVQNHVDELDVDVEEATTKYGNTALHIAVKYQHPELVEYLWDEGAAVDAQNGQGQTAMHLAVLNGDSAMVNRLLKFNPNLDLASQDGGSPLLVAAINGHRDIVQLLKQVRIREHMESQPQAVNARKSAQAGGNVRVIRKDKDEL